EIIYTPPDHKRIKALINDLVNWVTSDEPFVHPVLKASIIHFYLSYVHPFVDGNGRTARSLFYLEMLGSNYNIMRFLSISTVINKHKSLYYKVFKEVEDNESDLTYFLIFSMKVVYEAFKNVENKIAWAVIQFMKDNLHINKRQLRLMKGFCFKRYDELSVEKYIKINNIAYETARKDLNQLVKWNLLNKKKNGKKYYYFMSK
ncbi:MAG: Fic family protein, partial [Spirochaetota bacterium]|nr:Fic family protein [Spirochaetota bacterium]